MNVIKQHLGHVYPVIHILGSWIWRLDFNLHLMDLAIDVERRSRFFKKLAKAWKAACRAHPKEWRILAGDANLPTLMQHLSGQRCVKDANSNEQFRSASLNDLQLANATLGEPKATHNRGDVLDLILVDKGIQV